MSTQRLKNYYKRYLRNYRSRFVCGCCHQFIWEISDNNYDQEKAEYTELAAYAYRVRTIMYSRADLEQVNSENEAKRNAKKVRSNNGGHQKKSHEKRKKEKIRLKFKK
jgi:hypothetical protein